MSGTDSFPKNLPASLNVGQRLAIEGLDTACDMIHADFSTIKALISSAPIAKNEMILTDDQKLTMIKCAWSIIDRIDFIRQVLNFQKENIVFVPNKAQSEAIYKSSSMRNSMDHALGTMKTLSNKNREYPFFGIVGWVWVNSDDATAETDGKIRIKARNLQLISATTTHHKFSVDHSEILTNTIYYPWGNLNLWAFGKRVKLDDLGTLARDIQNHLRTVTAEITRKTFAEHSEDMIPLKGRFSVVLREDFNEDRIIDTTSSLLIRRPY